MRERISEKVFKNKQTTKRNSFVTRVEEQNLSEKCKKVGGNLPALFQPSNYIYRRSPHTGQPAQRCGPLPPHPAAPGGAAEGRPPPREAPPRAEALPGLPGRRLIATRLRAVARPRGAAPGRAGRSRERGAGGGGSGRRRRRQRQRAGRGEGGAGSSARPAEVTLCGCGSQDGAGAGGEEAAGAGRARRRRAAQRGGGRAEPVVSPRRREGGTRASFVPR